MNLSQMLFLLLFCFLAFILGLNLGLHQLISNQEKTSNEYNNLKTNYDSKNTFKSNMTNNFENTLKSTKYIQSSNRLLIGPESVDYKPPSSSQMKTIANTIQDIFSVEALKKLLIASNDKLENTDLMKEREMSLFLSNKNNKLPILLMTCNRPELLEKTIDSLLNVRGVTKDMIIVSQDGTLKSIGEIVKKNDLLLVQNSEIPHNLRGGIVIEGAQRIAMHYKFSLSSAFAMKPEAPAIIIVEDDLLFSPDFYEYFLQVIPALELDPTLFLASAWNDNGFKKKVMDKTTLMRTEYFPGLGWMIPRNLYKNELEKYWPNEHWDHWLRSPEINKGREIVYPQVPRSYHNGIKGTFMNLETHNQYFRDIDYNLDPTFHWNKITIDNDHLYPAVQVIRENYDQRIEETILRCKHIDDLVELFEENANKIFCVWIDVDPDPYFTFFREIGNFFGIWHEFKRGSHRGLHEFYWNGNYVMLLNSFAISGITSFSNLKPMNTKTFSYDAFDSSTIEFAKKKSEYDKIDFEIVASTITGQNCEKVRMTSSFCIVCILYLISEFSS